MHTSWQKTRTRKKAVWSTVLHTAILSLLLLPSSNVSTAKPPEFVTIAEGHTSASQDRGIEAGYRMFSAPDMKELCSGASQPAKLVIQNEPLALRVDEWFALDQLVILAADADGQPLPPAPITLEVEEPEPPVLDLRSDRIAEARVLPVRTGSFRLRVRTLCSDPAVEALIHASVSGQ